MSKRVTILLDEDVIKKLHRIQSKLIKESTSSVSFSKVVNLTLSKHLKS